MRVGIVAITDPTKGLMRDAECLVWALGLRERRRPIKAVSVFGLLSCPDETLACLAAIPCLGTGSPILASFMTPHSFPMWVTTVDTIFFNEILPEAHVALAAELKKRVIWFPNLDWATPNRIEVARRYGIEVVGKTPKTAKIFREKTGLPTRTIFWSIPDPVLRRRPNTEKRSLRFLFLGGTLGYQGRRGLPTVISAYQLLRLKRNDFSLKVRSIYPTQDLPGGIEYSIGFVPREGLQREYEDADVVLYPSRWEGFGLSLLEALHAGLPAIATDCPPMSEIVAHHNSGLLVQGKTRPPMHLAPAKDVAPSDLALAMEELIQNPDLVAKMTSNPEELETRQRVFCRAILSLVEERTERP